MITAIILAGGVGSRVGDKRPKQFIEVYGKPIIYYTLNIFEHNSEIDAIEVVCHKEWKEYLQNIVNKYGFLKVKWIVDGGDTFQKSVQNGIYYLKDKISMSDYVLIHYGAAPFTSEEIVSDVIRIMKIEKSAVSATPCYQLLGSNDGGISKHWIDRDSIVQIASPYGFEYRYILDVYDRAERSGLLDTVEPHTTSLIYALGDKIYLAYGDQTNIKITTKADVALFEKFISH